MALLPVDEALDRLLADALPCEAETIPIAQAAWRVLAADIHAHRTQPPFPASAMDGYAVRASDATEGAQLALIGESAAGRRFAGTVGAGQCARIFTGAPVPDGADAIVLQEDVDPSGPGLVRIRERAVSGRHIRAAGLDFKAGDRLLPAGRLLDPAALSLAAAGNNAALQVVRRPVVAILATGDELVAPGETPGPDQIVASNSYGVAAAVTASGGVVRDLGIVRDDRESLAVAIDAARDADILVTLGGASVGDHDLVREMLVAAGMSLDFWKIAMRPGKPLMFARNGRQRVLGLPGNPVSSLVCTELFVKPLVTALAGRPARPALSDARLGAPMKPNDNRRDYVRATVVFSDGERIATPFARQDSSMLSALASANGLIVREPFAPAAEAGAACKVLMLR